MKAMVEKIDLMQGIRAVLPHTKTVKESPDASCVHLHTTGDGRLILTGWYDTQIMAVVDLADGAGEITSMAVHRDDMQSLVNGFKGSKEETLEIEFEVRSSRIGEAATTESRLTVSEASALFGGRVVRVGGVDAERYHNMVPDIWDSIRSLMIKAQEPQTGQQPADVGMAAMAKFRATSDGLGYPATVRLTSRGTRVFTFEDRAVGAMGVDSHSGWSEEEKSRVQTRFAYLMDTLVDAKAAHPSPEKTEAA